MSPLGAVYAALTRVVDPLAPGLLALRGIQGEEREQRLGRVPPDPLDEWWHAASMGEVMALEPIVRCVRQRIPRARMRVTTQTRTGQAAARERWGDAVRYAPLDTPGALRRVLAAGAPRSLVLVETELWPNWLNAFHRSGIHTAVVSARLSDRAWPRTRRLRSLYAPLLAPMRAIAARTEVDAERYLELGAGAAAVRVTGNVKHDRLPEPDPAAIPWPSDPLWVVGSLRPGEETPVLDAFAHLRGNTPALRLVLALRHPDQWPDLPETLAARGWRTALRSRPESKDPEADVLIVDTHGELGGLYARATMALVGGTLVPLGGHNVMEPAVCGTPVLVGPHTATVREETRRLLAAGGAVEIHDAPSLAEAVRVWLDPERRRAASQAARGVARELRGAGERTVDWLQERGVLHAG